MKRIIFKGNCTAIVTPFDVKTGKVNYQEFKRLIDYQIDNGTSAIVFLGTTGESTTLTKIEKLNIIKFAVAYVCHRVPVIVGAGSNNTLDAIKNSIEYSKLGVDALLHITPYYNKATQNGLIEHFTAIANCVEIPIILYNVPSRTGVNMLPQTVQKLSEIQNIVAIKEASGNIAQVMEIKRLCGDNLTIYSGDDALTYPMLSVGALGAISVVGNIEPKMLSLMYQYYFEGHYETSYGIHEGLLPIINALFYEVNPIPIKYALSLYGFKVGNPRLPLTKLTYENQNKLKELILNYNA